MWPAEGSYLGHYRLVQKIDEGGMGMVYKAHEAALDRFVAIKVLSPELAKDADFVRSFLREARAVAALNHPNIIQIYFIGQHDEFIYFAMELIEGHAFDRLGKLEKKPSAKEWLGYFKQAAMGLQYAHNHGVIHRDIKPANLILNEAGFVKVADFGLARKMGSGGESAANIADSMGTPEYMSPEESQGETVDHRSDMYSLGASLFHMLAGKAPFTGASGTEIMMHQIHTPLPSLKKLNPQVPQPIVAIVEKLLEKNPKNRFQSYDELIKAMDAATHGKPVATRIAVPSAPSHNTGRHPRVERKGPGALTWLLILGILGAAGFGVWKISENQKMGNLQPVPQPSTNQHPSTSTGGTTEPGVVRPHPRPPPRPATNTTAQVEPPPENRPVAWVSLNILEAYNRNTISRKSGEVDGFTVDKQGVLMTKAVRASLGLPGTGLPDDGLLWIPEIVPFGRYKLNYEHGDDCIWFSGQNGNPRPINIRISGSQRERYAYLSLLSAAANANGKMQVTMHFTVGPDWETFVDLHNVHSSSAGLLRGAKVAAEVTPGRGGENFTLYSQVVPCDPTRALRGITLVPSDIKPVAIGATPQNIVAGVFAISALPAGRGVINLPFGTNITVLATTPPTPTNTETTTTAPIPEADYRALSTKLFPLISSFQMTEAAAELARLATAGGEPQRDHWTAVAADLKRIAALKQRTIGAVSDKAGRNVALTYRSGARLDAQLSSANSDEVTLRKILPSAGFISTPVRWADLAPASLLTVVATVADPNSTDDLHDYGLLLLYQALAGHARPEDAQRALAAALARDPKLKAEVDDRLKWLATDDDKQAGTEPPATDPTPQPTTTSGNTPRVERGITVAGGIARWGWTCLDIGPACNTDIIYTETRAATEEFGGGIGWTTAGWLSRNNIAGDFSGIPDDGRVMLPDLEPRTALQITMPPRRNAILLTAETGRQPRPVRLDLPTDLRINCRGIALLHASNGGDALLNLDLVYTDGTIRTRPLQTLDWRAGGRSHDFGPGQTIALSTRSSRVTSPNRVDMTVQLVPASEERKLAALIFSYASGTPPKDVEGSRASPAAAIFAVSIHPANGN